MTGIKGILKERHIQKRKENFTFKKSKGVQYWKAWLAKKRNYSIVGPCKGHVPRLPGGACELA
jgi:hypothetical protein